MGARGGDHRRLVFKANPVLTRRSDFRRTSAILRYEERERSSRIILWLYMFQPRCFANKLLDAHKKPDPLENLQLVKHIRAAFWAEKTTRWLPVGIARIIGSLAVLCVGRQARAMNVRRWTATTSNFPGTELVLFFRRRHHVTFSRELQPLCASVKLWRWRKSIGPTWHSRM